MINGIIFLFIIAQPKKLKSDLKSEHSKKWERCSIPDKHVVAKHEPVC